MTTTSRLAGLGMALGLGFCAVACGTEATDPEPATHGLPALTVEEQAVVDNMANGTLAEIDLPDGKMRFMELAPGEVVVTRTFRAGSEFKQVEGESSMTLDQVFHAYAPDREIPRPLMDAAARAAALPVDETVTPRPAATMQEVGFARPISTAITPSAGGAVERTTSALASSIDAGWFTSRFCNTSFADGTSCRAAVGTGYGVRMRAHRTNVVFCGDTGAVRGNTTRDGGVWMVFDVGYTQCFVISGGGYHGPHGLFGINLERDLQHNVTFAQSTARVASWFATEDQFIGNGW